MKLTFNLEEIQGIEFYTNDVIRVWFFYGNPISIIVSRVEFEDWLKYKEYDQHITYDDKDLFEDRVIEYLKSKCIDEPIQINTSLLKESLDLAFNLAKKLSSLNNTIQSNSK